tara:strand:+ start:5050 stop:5232 length:183 start_codon:yes stop_codon:yes gene_type:complete
MKYYKHVTLRSTSGNKINLPKEAWSKLGWKLNDKLKISFGFGGPYDGANPSILYIEKADD